MSGVLTEADFEQLEVKLKVPIERSLADAVKSLKRDIQSNSDSISELRDELRMLRAKVDSLEGQDRFRHADWRKENLGVPFLGCTLYIPCV